MELEVGPVKQAVDWRRSRAGGGMLEVDGCWCALEVGSWRLQVGQARLRVGSWRWKSGGRRLVVHTGSRRSEAEGRPGVLGGG